MQLIKDKKQFDEVIKEKCLVDFSASWCSPCKMLTPLLEEIEQEIKNVKFYKVDIENDELEEIAKEYEITGVPCCIVFEDSIEHKRLTGYNLKQKYLEILA